MKPPEQTRLVVFDTIFFYIIKNRVVVRTSVVCRWSRRSGLKKDRGCFEKKAKRAHPLALKEKGQGWSRAAYIIFKFVSFVADKNLKRRK